MQYCFFPNLVDVLERVEDVVGQTRKKINDEPSLQVVHANDLGVADDLAVRTDEGRLEVEDDVDEEDDVDDRVDDEQRHVVHGLVAEGAVEGDHDGGVEGECEDEPVPAGFVRRVVQDDVGGSLR